MNLLDLEIGTRYLRGLRVPKVDHKMEHIASNEINLFYAVVFLLFHLILKFSFSNFVSNNLDLLEDKVILVINTL